MRVVARQSAALAFEKTESRAQGDGQHDRCARQERECPAAEQQPYSTWQMLHGAASAPIALAQYARARLRFLAVSPCDRCAPASRVKVRLTKGPRGAAVRSARAPCGRRHRPARRRGIPLAAPGRRSRQFLARSHLLGPRSDRHGSAFVPARHRSIPPGCGRDRRRIRARSAAIPSNTHSRRHSSGIRRKCPSVLGRPHRL